jgi:N-acylneuraminate cytidylyltransferase
MNSKKKIAIIPARGGSKRIPRKNIREFCGHPIIKYSIDVAKNAGCFDEIIVSTEDEEIAAIAEELGGSVPFLRSKKCASDIAALEDVTLEVIEKFEKIGKRFDYICCILSTAPFITVDRILEGLKILKDKNVDSVFPVTGYAYPIQRALKINEDSTMSLIWPENDDKRSQELIPAFHDAGQFYWARREPFLRQHRFFSDNCYPLEISSKEVQDIDTEDDWQEAELKYKILREINSK